MGWETPWYTLTDDFDADFDVDEWAAPEFLEQAAIEVLKDQRISELPVVDALGKPIGLLDITDVLAVQEIAATQPSGATRSRRRAAQPPAAGLGADGVVRMVPKRRRA